MTVGLSSVNGLDLLRRLVRCFMPTLNGDAYLTGSIDEFRIYNGALGVLSLQQSDLTRDQTPVLADGPGQLVLFNRSPLPCLVGAQDRHVHGGGSRLSADLLSVVQKRDAGSRGHQCDGFFHGLDW